MRPLIAGLVLALLTPAAQALNPQVAPFVPPGFSLVQGKAVDLNGDGHSDRLLVLEDTADPDGPRTLLILMGMRQGFRLGAEAGSVLLCRECGGAWGDPLVSVQARRGWLSIQHYGGSGWWRWGSSHTFSLRDGRWVLTALEEYSRDPGGRENSYHIPPSECQNTDLTRFVCKIPGAETLRVSSARAYFHTAPVANSRSKSYVVAGQQVTVYRTYRTFVEAEYVDGQGRRTQGFLRRADLTP